MNALVTGAGGFIGSHLVRHLLQKGCSVRGLVHEDRQHESWMAGAEITTADVRNQQAMKVVTAGCETVYHLAGKAHALSEIPGDNEEVYYTINTDGTRHVLEGAIAGGAKAFVLFSSVKVMGEGSNQCQDESFNGLPVTPYGRSKLDAERVVLDISRQAGLHATCLRLPLVYGPGSKGNLFRMIMAIDRGLFPPLQETGNHRSMVHVGDVVKAAVLAAETPTANGQCYIVTDGRTYSTRELSKLIHQALGRRISPWNVPLWTFKILALAGDVIGRVRAKRFAFDSDALDKLIGSARYSSEKISRELGYSPTYCFEDALGDMISSYRSARL